MRWSIDGRERSTDRSWQRDMPRRFDWTKACKAELVFNV
jgi:hypothetical protein